MKVLRHDDTVLQLRPCGGTTVFVIGVLLLLSLPLWVYFLGRTTTLTCERPSAGGSARCTLNRTVLGLSLDERAIEALNGAYVSDTRDSDGDVTYQVILRSGRSEIPLTNYRSSGYRKKQATVNEINDFVEDTTIPTLMVEAGTSAGLIVAGVDGTIGLLMVVIGVQMMFTTWTFDHSQGQFFKHKETPIGVRTWSYELDEIVDVHVGTSRDSDGDTTYRVEIFTNRGEVIPMTAAYSSGYRKKQETVMLLRSFLGLE
jgi:hypothetical protein